MKEMIRDSGNPNNKPTNETNHWTFVELNRECKWDTGVFVYILCMGMCGVQ